MSNEECALLKTGEGGQIWIGLPAEGGGERVWRGPYQVRSSEDSSAVALPRAIFCESPYGHEPPASGEGEQPPVLLEVVPGSPHLPLEISPRVVCTDAGKLTFGDVRYCPWPGDSGQHVIHWRPTFLVSHMEAMDEHGLVPPLPETRFAEIIPQEVMDQSIKAWRAAGGSFRPRG